MDFKSHKVAVNGTSLHVRTAGTGISVILLHGWPQSSYAWRRLAPLLTARYRVIVPDLRGFGDSEKPESGYDTRNMAQDICELLQTFEAGRAFVVGTDMGLTVAFALAAFFPTLVERLVLCEMVVPGFGTEELEPRLWHWGFLKAPGTAELLVGGRERAYLENHFAPPYLLDPNAIGPDDLDEYARVYSKPGAFAATLRIYRALDESAQQNRHRIEKTGKLTLPVLSIGAEKGLAGTVFESAARVAINLRGWLLPSSSHYIAEEKPGELANELLSFFAT